MEDKFTTKYKIGMKRFINMIDESKLTYNQHQYDGVSWCLKNEMSISPPGNVHGGFICDEMGLGKTLMMIGVIISNYLKRTLIILPPILIHQWRQEIYKSTGHKALVYHGTEKKHITQEDINRAPIVITSYYMTISKQSLIRNVEWKRVIIDEAHHLRNSNIKIYKGCCEIKSNIRWLITGTPVQNKIRDFNNLCKLIGMQDTFYKNSNNHTIIGKLYLLRRTKKEIGIQLPSIIKHKEVVKWGNKSERQLSKAIHSLIPNISGVKGTNKKQKQIADSLNNSYCITQILRARQVCIYPGLLRNRIQTLYKEGRLPFEALEGVEVSSKIYSVVKLMLKRKDNGRGKIVFCHFQGEIDEMKRLLLKGGMTQVNTYDGRNSGGDLKRISEPADALIIQIQTGSEGLNLQDNFSEIYFTSAHWNPSIEEQAIARCHRFGQQKHVDVFRFEMIGFEKAKESNCCSIDNYIVGVQNNKKCIIEEVFDALKIKN